MPFSPLHFLLGAILLGQAVVAATAPPPAPPRLGPIAAPPTPITTVAGAFARWPELQSDEGLVRLEGVVTGTMPSGAFRLHDGELGIYVSRSAAGQKLTAGDRVAVSGVLRKGGFSPWITPYEVTSLGRGEFPRAEPVSYAVLATGTADNQWVEIEGVVRAVQVPEGAKGLVVLDLGMLGGSVRALVNCDSPADCHGLIDAEVTLRGVAAVNVNAQKHVVEPSFRVPSLAQITTRRPRQPDPFALVHTPIERLMKFSPGASHLHRVRTRGVVMRRLSDTTFFVRDGRSTLKVETARAHAVRPGEIIEAAGFPVIAEGMAVLQHSVARSVGTTEPPSPAEPTLTALLEGTYNSNLVSIKARLVDSVTAGRNVTLVFQAGDQIFTALFTQPAAATAPLPAKNSFVRVTGICVIDELEAHWSYRPRSFLLLLADLDDLQILQAPPWWTPERLGWALVITCTVLLAAAAWVWALRRQIGRKRAVIEQQARHAATLEERSRIARNLHDTLEQGLTGLSLQMKALENDLNATPLAARTRLASARQMLRQSRALARNAIRELRTETMPSRHEALLDGLHRVANAWNQSGALRVSVSVIGEPRPLPPPLEPHLLGIGTEAMTNAVKHGQAQAIDVALTYGATEVTLRIRDDGVGFDPAGQHAEPGSFFGLLGMRERAREIRGQLDVQSAPGRGTEVVVRAPIVSGNKAEDAADAGVPTEVLRARAPAA